MKISSHTYIHKGEFISKNYKESNGELISPPWQFPARKSLVALSANLLFHGLIHSAFLVRGHYSRHSGRVAHAFLFKRRHYVNRSRYQVEKPSCKMQLCIQSVRCSLVVATANLRDPLWFISRFLRIMQDAGKLEDARKIIFLVRRWRKREK